ncbi:MAG: TolC family protein [Bacteroidales bacterium]|nr:TolC family protein [Bacteroidales bacterium]
MKNIFLIAAALLFSVEFTLNAQKTWTLEECIQYAHQNNIQIKRQELLTEITENNYQQSKLDRLPNVNAGVFYNFSSGRNLNTETYKWEDTGNQEGSLGISSDLNLFNGFQVNNTIQMNHLDLMRDLQLIEKTKNDITMSIATSYLQILFDYELVELAQSQKNVTQQQVERTKKLVESGNRAKGDLLEIQAQLSNDVLNLTNAENNLKIGYLQLIQLLQLELDSVNDFTILRPELAEYKGEIEKSVSEYYNLALNHLPEIKSSEYNLLAREKSLAIAKGKRSPRFYLGADYYSRYNKNATNLINVNETYGLLDQLNDNQYRQLSLNLNIPIFNRRTVETNISNNRILLDDAGLILEQTKRELLLEIQQAHSDATSALVKYNASYEAVRSNEESFNYTQQKFEVGLVNSVDYNIAKTTCLKPGRIYCRLNTNTFLN